MGRRGKPMESHQTIIKLISATRTNKGLTVQCELDDNVYAKGRKKTDQQMAALNIKPYFFHGEWNYTLYPSWMDQGAGAVDGGIWSPAAFTDQFRRLTRRHGIALRFHDLRHSHATQLLMQGVHPKIVSERLGHSTIALTLDTYSHVLPTMQDEAAALIDASLRAAMDLD
jgi:integrase